MTLREEMIAKLMESEGKTFEQVVDSLLPLVEKFQADALKWRLFYAADETLGIYPAAVKGGDSPYTVRSDYMNGWNAACMSLLHAHSAIEQTFKSLPEETRAQLMELMEEEIVMWSCDDNKADLALMVSDRFYYACADAEEITFSDIAEIHKLNQQFDYAGVLAWVARKRDALPLEMYQDEKFKAARAALSEWKQGK